MFEFMCLKLTIYTTRYVFMLESSPRAYIQNNYQWVLNQGVFVYLCDFIAKVSVDIIHLKGFLD